MSSNLATQYYRTIQELEKQLNEFRRENRMLQEKLGERDRTIAVMQERIAALEEENRKLRGMGKKLQRIIFKGRVEGEGTSNTMHRRGAQTGHVAHVRRKPNDEEITEQREVRLSQCPHCEAPIDGGKPHGWTERTVTDIPLPVEPIVIRYHIARYHCGHCDRWVQGLPSGTIPRSPFGINLVMLVLHEKYRGKATDNHVREQLLLRHGIAISKGGVHSILEQAAQLFGPSYEAVKQAIREGKVVQADETGWRVAGENWYAWAFLNEHAVFFTIENTRGKGIPERELQGFDGCLVSDGLQSYNAVTTADHQLCVIHFLRHTHEIAEMEDASGEARWFHAQVTWFFRQARKRHRRCRSPDERRMLHGRMLRALERYWRDRTYEDAAVETTKQWWLEARGAQLLTFLQHEDVPWHNNAAERVIRPLVTRRKVCGGSRSERGAEREAINMSCVMTILRQGKSLFEEIPRMFAAGLGRRGAVETVAV